MIVGSIALALLAVGLLIAGLIKASDALLYSSIAASALAAVVLIVGLRLVPSARMALGGVDSRERTPAPRPIGRASVPPPSRAQPGMPTPSVREASQSVPCDEPAPQELMQSQATRLAQLARELNVEVMVVDGRPRYHLTECPHLLGRACERLVPAEAIQLGFTPCAQCEPATALLLGVPRA